jgi:hypothetical protein
MAFARIRLAPGTRTIKVKARSQHLEQKLTIKPGGFAVVNLTVLE